jgi:hypothetical protein
MKKILTAAYAVFVIALFASCADAGLDVTPPPAIIDTADPLARAINLPDSSWSDTLNPATTLEFSATQVTLGGGQTQVIPDGEATKTVNWYWGAKLDGQTYTFDMIDDTAVMEDIINKIENNYGYDTPLPDAMVVVWTNVPNQIGFQLYYYAAKTTGRYNYDRLVCWGIGQPHEFKRTN